MQGIVVVGLAFTITVYVEGVFYMVDIVILQVFVEEVEIKEIMEFNDIVMLSFASGYYFSKFTIPLTSPPALTFST